jgi:hypothetical protein
VEELVEFVHKCQKYYASLRPGAESGLDGVGDELERALDPLLQLSGGPVIVDWLPRLVGLELEEVNAALPLNGFGTIKNRGVGVMILA